MMHSFPAAPGHAPAEAGSSQDSAPPIPPPPAMAKEGTAVGGVMDINTALQEVRKTALSHDGLASDNAQPLFECLHPAVMRHCRASWWRPFVLTADQANEVDDKKPGQWAGLRKTD